MKTKTWAFSLQGLLAMAEAGPFQRDPRYGAWAKAMFDRSLDLYERLEEGPERGIPAAGMFGVDQARRDVPDGRLLAARMGANAVRALTAGLGRMASEEPPAFYAFDRDVGRLAVSTPSYSTAVVAVNRGAFPYGGNELARLHDRDGDVIGGIGGRVPAAFGVVVRDAAGRRVLATQVGRDDAASPPVALRAWPRTGRNGPFRVLRTSAVRRARGVVATTRHTFRAELDRAVVDGALEAAARSRSPRCSRAGGPTPASRRRCTTGASSRSATPLDLAGVRDFVVRSSDGAYRVTPVGTVAGRARVIAVRRQPSAPLAGPSLELRLPRARTSRAARPPAAALSLLIGALMRVSSSGRRFAAAHHCRVGQPARRGAGHAQVHGRARGAVTGALTVGGSRARRTGHRAGGNVRAGIDGEHDVDERPRQLPRERARRSAATGSRSTSNGRLIDGVGLGAGIRNNGFDDVRIVSTTGTARVQEFDRGLQLNAGTLRNTVERITWRHNEFAGIELNNTDSSTIRTNTIHNTSKFGLSVNAGSASNVITGNTVHTNGQGVQLVGATANRLETNRVATNSDFGVELAAGASSNTLLTNTIVQNGDAAAIVAAGSNRIERNTIDANGDAGITVIGAAGNQLLTNTIRNSSDAAINLENASASTLRGNDVRLNPRGIDLKGSVRNRLESNNASSVRGAASRSTRPRPTTT